MLEELLAAMTGEFPALREVFVHERDVFLTHSLQNAAMPEVDRNGKILMIIFFIEIFKFVEFVGIIRPMRVVGVVGIGHVPGIQKLWGQVQAPYIESIMLIPPPTLTSKLIRISFKLSLLSFGGFLIYKYVPGTKTVTHSIYNNCQFLIQSIIKYTKSL